MGAAKGVVHVEVAESGKLLCERGVVGFFLSVEAEVFQQQRLTLFEIRNKLSRNLADAIRGKAYVLVFTEDVVQQFTQTINYWAQAECGNDLALGAPEVGAEDDAGLAAEGVLNSWYGLADAGVVEDLVAIFRKRHVEVDADEHALAGKIEIADGELGHETQDKRRVRLLGQDGINFNLYLPPRVDKCRDDEHGGGWANERKELAVNPCRCLPIFNAREIDAGAHDVLERGAGLLENVSDDGQALVGLAGNISVIAPNRAGP